MSSTRFTAPVQSGCGLVNRLEIFDGRLQNLSRPWNGALGRDEVYGAASPCHLPETISQWDIAPPQFKMHVLFFVLRQVRRQQCGKISHLDFIP